MRLLFGGASGPHVLPADDCCGWKGCPTWGAVHKAGDGENGSQSQRSSFPPQLPHYPSSSKATFLLSSRRRPLFNRLPTRRYPLYPGEYRMMSHPLQSLTRPSRLTIYRLSYYLVRFRDPTCSSSLTRFFSTSTHPLYHLEVRTTLPIPNPSLTIHLLVSCEYTSMVGLYCTSSLRLRIESDY